MKYIVQPVIDGATNFPGANPQKKYWMASVNSGLVASANGNSIQIVQRKWNENDDQQWRFEPLTGNDNGYYKVVSAKDGKALSLASAAEVILGPWNGAVTQHWSLINLGFSKFRIEPRNKSGILDIEGSSKTEGSRVYLNLKRPALEPESSILSQQWSLAEICENRLEGTYNKRAIIYRDPNFQGTNQEIGVGSYLTKDLKIGSDALSSLKVPEGLRVTLYENENFRGRKKVFTENAVNVGDFNDITSSVVVEPVVMVYYKKDYLGTKQYLGVGNYNKADLIAGVGEDAISSLRVPQGLIVTLYENPEFKGRTKTFLEDAPYVGLDFDDKTSSVTVKAIGVVIPENALKFGSTISLKSFHGKYLFAKDDGSAIANEVGSKEMGFFTIMRSGNTKHSSFISYGDIVSLVSIKDKFLSVGSDGKCSFSSSQLGVREKFTLIRAGSSEDKNFVTANDIIGLKSVDNTFMSAWTDGKCNFPVKWLREWEQWKMELVAPAEALRYGSTICLRSFHGKYLSVATNGTMTADKSWCREWEHYTVIRSGNAKYNSLISFGDVISLQSFDGKYLIAWPLSNEGIGKFGTTVINDIKRITVVKPGNDKDNSIVISGDIIALKSYHGTFMSAWPEGKCTFPVTLLKDWEKWTIASAAAVGAAATGGSVSTGGSGPGACGAAACGAAACLADYCGGAACAAAAGLFTACGLAASVVAVCGADVAGIGGCVAAASGASACGAAACGAAACYVALGGVGACGADACAGAVCTAAACGAAACAAAACGGDSCGADSDAANACTAKAGLVSACPADACLADACIIDLIPIIPGI
ncbi:MAG: Cys-every-fifth RiPP peptide CefA [Methanothrix sp.]|nr:Cys-every-fifth RiPP peptide CefA [Methanothrix sp.]